MSMIVKMQRRYGSEWYLKNDDGNVAWVAPMVKEHIERIEAENANLREELESVGMAAYLYGRGDLRAENDKLRELINRWADAFDRWAAENGGYGRYFDGSDWQGLANDIRYDLAEACGELGIEVDE